MRSNSRCNHSRQNIDETLENLKDAVALVLECQTEETLAMKHNKDVIYRQMKFV